MTEPYEDHTLTIPEPVFDLAVPGLQEMVDKLAAISRILDEVKLQVSTMQATLEQAQSVLDEPETMKE